LRAFFKRLLLLSSSGEPCSVCIGEFDIAGLLGMLGEADQGDAVKRVVRRPIATARQPMAHSLAEDAGTGAAPHNAAKEASPLSRCGLSPAVTRSCAAVSGPTP
jgi:hypothetical protein